MNDSKLTSPTQGIAPAHPKPVAPAHGIHPVPTSINRTSAVSAATVKPPTSDEDLMSVELVEEAAAETTKSKIHGFSVAASHHTTHQWKRQPHHIDNGVIRVRTFHGRISEQGLEYLDNTINDWLDKNPDIELKNVTSTVGLFDGKIKEPALILNLWY